MKNIFKYYFIVLSVLLLRVGGGGGGGGGGVGGGGGETTNNNESNSSVKYATPNTQIGDTNEHVLAIATDIQSSESFSVIGEIDGSGNPTSITKMVFIADDGTSSEIEMGSDGRPLAFSAGDDYTIRFTNYTSNSVDVSIYDKYDFLIQGPTTYDDSNDFIATIVNNSFSSVFANQPFNLSRTFLSDEQSAALIRTGSTIYGATLCGISLFGGPIAAFRGCSLPLLSVVASVSGNSTLQKISFAINANACKKSIYDMSKCVAFISKTIAYGFDSKIAVIKPKLLEPKAGSKMVTLEWASVPGADSYNIYYKKNWQTQEQVIPNITGNRYVHNNLDNGEIYEFSIEGVRNRDSALSLRSEIQVARPYPTKPPIPQNVFISEISYNQVNVTWNYVPEAYEGYRVFFRAEKSPGVYSLWDNWWSPQIESTDSTVSKKVEFLKSSTQYQFYVYSLADGVRGDKSLIVTAQTQAKPVAPPVLVSPPSTAVKKVYSYVYEQTVRLFWWGSSEATSYNIYYGPTTGQSPGSYAFVKNIQNDKTSFVFDTIPFNQDYFFTVTPVNESGEGPVSNEVSEIILAPTIVTSPNLLQPITGNGEVTLAWDSVPNTERYDLYFGTTSGSYDTLLTNVSSPIVIPNLINDTNYYFAIKAVIGTDESPYSIERIGIPTVPPAPPSQPSLNDTGLVNGFTYPSVNNVGCTGTTIAQQDCSHGRDATNNNDSDGHAGFSFTKLDENGQVLLDQTLPYTATEHWNCVRDNVTGLTWEVKQEINGAVITGIIDGTLLDERLHDVADRFNWFSTNNDKNGGAPGFDDADGNICYGYDVNDPATYCNTEAYVMRVNAAGLCGFRNWRLPTRNELVGIVNLGRDTPTIDVDYFPNTISSQHWTSTPRALNPQYSWNVNFKYGKTTYFGFGGRDDTFRVRLVHN